MAVNNRLVVRHKQENIDLPPGTPPPFPPRAPGSTGIIVSRQDITGNIVSGGVEFTTTGLPSIVNGEPNDLAHIAHNRGVLFRNEIYVGVASSVFRFDHGPGVWVEEARLPFAPVGWNRQIGLYPMILNNAPYLVTAYQRGTTATWESIRLNGITNVWESGSTGTLYNHSNDGIHAEVVHNRKVYFQGNDNSVLGVYDPATQTFDTITHSPVINFPTDLATYSGVLYQLHSNASNEIKITKVEGSVGFETLTLSDGAGGNEISIANNTFGRCLLFTDNLFTTADSGVDGASKLYAFYMCNPAVGFDGWGVWHLEGNGKGDLTEIRRHEEVLLGAGLRSGNGTADIDPAGAWRVIYDQQTLFASGLGVPDYTFIFREQGGGDHNNYRGLRFTDPDPSLPLANVESFTYQWHMAYPQDKLGGGARFSPYTTALAGLGVSNVPILGIGLRGNLIPSEVNGNTRISYNLLPSSGDGAHAGVISHVRWFYNTYGEMALTPCTLEDSSDGVIEGNVIYGVVAESGKTYTVDWKAAADGVANNVLVNMVGFVATTGT